MMRKITTKEIAETYIAYKGRKRSDKGKKDNTLPLLPFYIMDVVYQIYCKDVKDIPCRHKMAQAKKRWAKSYHSFNMDFFLAFDEDQTDYIVDQMDEFGTYIHNTLVMFKSAAISAFNADAPFEEKKILASVLACNVLCQAAQHLYMDMYRKTNMKGERNKYIEDIQKASYDFANAFPASSKDIDLTSRDDVMKMIDVLCKKIIAFLRSKEEN